MTIKYAAKNISSEFRTPEELVNQDGITLKPLNDGEVFLQSQYSEVENPHITIGTNYNSSTGGCTVDNVTYSNIIELNNAGYYLISDVTSGWNLADLENIQQLNVPVVDTPQYKYAWVNNSHTTDQKYIFNPLDDFDRPILYYPEKTYRISARLTNDTEYTTNVGRFQATSDNNTLLQWQSDNTVSVQAIKYIEEIPNNYITLFTNKNGNPFEYINIRYGFPLYNTNGDLVPWNEHAKLIRYKDATAHWKTPGSALYVYNNNDYIGIYYNSSYVLMNVSTFVIDLEGNT